MIFPKVFRHFDKDIAKKYHSQHCIACGRRGAEGHHIKTKKSGGPDVDWNLMPLDRICHSKVHTIGLNKFSEIESVRNWLLANNWTFDEVKNKWQHD